MKRLLIIGFAVLLATGAMAATKADLKTLLIDSDKYLSVNDPVKVDGQKYKYIVTTATADPLVVNVGSVQAWVLDDGGPTEAAYFLKTNPTITTDDFRWIRDDRRRRVANNSHQIWLVLRWG